MSERRIAAPDRPVLLQSLYVLSALTIAMTACGPSEARQPDLPRQPDRWASSVMLDDDSKANYVGRTRDFVITTVTSGKQLVAPRAIGIGDEIEGVKIGAIKCSFFWRDASYNRQQYMWRGRWGCMAGRSRDEVERAVGPDGEKRFDYIHVSPVRLD